MIIRFVRGTLRIINNKNKFVNNRGEKEEIEDFPEHLS